MTTSNNPCPPASTFTELGLPAPLADVLRRDGITSPFPIQAATLPDALAGHDILGRGQTGSGKTLAFVLPLLARLSAAPRRSRHNGARALVLVPTRELATQVHAAMAPLAAASGLTTVTIFGGVGAAPQIKALKRGVDVIVACPGRLEDLMRQGHVRLDTVEISVLDEADHMADLGFLPAVRRILDKTPRDGQRLLFSATLDNGVDVLVRRYLRNPLSHDVVDEKASGPDIEHHVLTVSATDKSIVVRELASGLGRSVLFMRTKHSARKLARDLTAAGVPAVDLHGNLSQAARDRNLGRFRDGQVRVLVATDVAARGIHVDDVSLVIHVDPPAEHKAYTHRSGRTARAGASGVVVTLQTTAQRRDVATMTKRAGVRATVASVGPGSPELIALSGPLAPTVTPTAAPSTSAAQGRTRTSGSRKPAGRRNGRPSRSSGSSSTSSSAPRRKSAATGGTGGARSSSAADFSARTRRSR